MTTPADHADARDGLTLLLGPRQADIMRLFWTHGQATMRQVQQWLTKDADLAYSTIATLCSRLVEKGLLRQQVGESNGRDRRAVSHVYAPLISEDDFVCAAVEQQLDRLLAHYPDLVFSYVAQHVQCGGASGLGEDVGDRAVERSLASLAPPRVAERQAAMWEAQARRAQHQAKLATARYEKAEARAAQWEATARQATAQALAAEEDAGAIIRRVAREQHAAARSAPEHYDLAGVCRVCNQPVSDAPARRRDGLRVCAEEMCRQEARQRDRAAKQRQQRMRWRQRREHAGTLAG